MKSLSFIVFCLISFRSWALGPSEITQMAIDRSAFVSMSQLTQRAIELDAKLKKKWANPIFVSQIGGLKTGTNSGSTLEVSVTQAIPLNKKYSLRGDLADKLSEISELDIEMKKNWVSHQALLAAWRVKIFAILGNHISERKNRMGIAKVYISKRPQVTSKQIVEAQIINNQIRILENTLNTIRVEVESAQIELEYWTGIQIAATDINLDFPLIEQVQFSSNQQEEKDFEMKVAKKQLEASSIELEMYKKEKLPDFIIGGGYRVERVNTDNHFSYGIIGLTIPVWDTGEERVQASKARIQREEKLLSEKQKSYVMRQEKFNSQLRYFESIFKTFFFQDVAKQEKMLKIAENGFKQGLVDINTFLQTEVQAHEIIDQIYLNWMKYLETLSQYHLTRGESLAWTR